MARNNTSVLIKTILAILAVIIVISYVFFNSRLFIKGPQITIETPKDGETITDQPLIKVAGKALNISLLELNGRQIYAEENNEF